MKLRGAALLLLLAACQRTPPSDAPDAAASPQASAMPAPLATPTTAPSATPVTLSPDAGPPPTNMRGDVPLDDRGESRSETIGYTLSAVFRPEPPPGPPRAPEVAAQGIEAARKKTELRLAIDLSPSRMRVALLGHGFMLPPDTEIRSRADRYGHVVLFPGGAYRPLPPGSLRALLGERRFDVAPILPAEVTSKDEPGKRIGVKTRKADVVTRAAKTSVEIGRVPDLGDGGVLLCRVLLDLMNAPPGTALCGADELPLRAEVRWTPKGSFTFEVTGLLKKTDLPTANLAVPPPNATYAQTPLPTIGVAPLLTPQELAAFRTGPVDVPPNAVTEGLQVVNTSDELRILDIDGVPALWASPGARDVLKGLPKGRYTVQWRTFLGDAVEPAFVTVVPGSTQLGTPDAGAR